MALHKPMIQSRTATGRESFDLSAIDKPQTLHGLLPVRMRQLIKNNPFLAIRCGGRGRSRWLPSATDTCCGRNWTRPQEIRNTVAEAVWRFLCRLHGHRTWIRRADADPAGVATIAGLSDSHQLPTLLSNLENDALPTE